MSRTGKFRPAKIAELNIVPMLDVCFNLLIFFIMVAQFSVGEAILPSDLPGHRDPDKERYVATPSPLVIALRSVGGDDCVIDMPGLTSAASPANFEQLYQKLHTVQGNLYSIDDPIIIQPDPQTPWDHAVNAFNAANRAHYKNISFRDAQP